MSTLQFSYSATTITITRPIYGYRSHVRMPFDLVPMENGLYSIYDAGNTYDVRECECTFVLNATDAAALHTMVDTTARGQSTISMVLPSDSGFFPFGADKGDAGTFTVAMEITGSKGVGMRPYLYFAIDVKLTNTGAYPSYSLPTQSDDGAISIGTVDNVRFPPDWFMPKTDRRVYQSLGRSGAVQYVDRGIYADTFEHTAIYKCQQPKAAAVINYLVGTARADTFTLTTANNHYAFDVRSNSADSYTVRLIQDTITTVHNNFNDFSIELALSREAII